MTTNNFLLWIILAAWFSLLAAPAQGEPVELEKIGTIQGIAVHPQDPTALYLATNSGLYLTTADKQARLLARNKDNLISIAVAHDETNTLYASGHPSIGGNLGLLQSKDYGHNWEHVSTNPDGPMAFEKMAISQSDPKTIYGVYQGLQVSHDGGISWSKVSAMPPGLFSIAVSGHDPKLLYAATRTGLYLSHDGGRSWKNPYKLQLPVTLVRTTDNNMIYAFVVSKGLMRKRESDAQWQSLNNQFGLQILLDLTVAPGKPEQVYAVNQFGRLLASINHGVDWHRFTGDPKPASETTRRGEKLYVTNCQMCHGKQGVGENYSMQSLADSNYLMATSLDDSTHAWHHSDDDLVTTILEGSPRNNRMKAWKTILSEHDARDIVAYIKSLWGQRALDCQGPRHMQCM